MVTLTTSIIIAGVCIIIGLGLGITISLAFTNRGSDSKGTTANPHAPYKQAAVLLRDPRDASLLTEIDGRLYASAEPLNDGQREMMDKTARDLYAWLRLPPEPEVPIKPVPRPAAEEKPTVPLAEMAKGSQASRPDAAQKNGPVPPLVAAAVASNVEKGKPAPPPKSIVEQIDEILQEMVDGTPLAEKSIRLVEEADHDVIVWIGLEHFEGINSVPDIEARTIIQAAVREWEKRSESSQNQRPY